MKKILMNLILSFAVILFFLQMPVLKVFAVETRLEAKSLNIENIRQETINGVPYIPLRSFFEALGWEVTWDSKTKEVVCALNNEKIRFIAGEKEIKINNSLALMDNSLLIISSRSYVPQRFIARQFGLKIRWNKKDNIIVASVNDTSSVTVNGGNNIVIVGDCIIANIFEPCSIQTLDDMISHSDRLLSSGNAREALTKYMEVLENISQDEAPDVYAHVMNNAANAYSKLSEYSSTKSNILAAIECYEKAIPFYRDNNDESNYSIILNNLGSAYRILADVTGDKTFADKAVGKYIGALVFYNKTQYSLDYAIIQYNMAKAYSLSGVKGLSAECCLNAKGAFEKVLSDYTIEENPSCYAMIQYSLGDINFMLEDMNPLEDRSAAATSCFDNALKVWTVESYPLDYAKVLRQSGYLHINAYGKSGNPEYLKKALKAFEESLNFYKPERFPLKYGLVNYDLGNTQILLAESGDIDILAAAAVSFERSLKVFSYPDYPKQYNLTIASIEKLKQMQMKVGVYNDEKN
ncbi:MAG: copper amine oxidase N-terminal domain-containing protein [Clostridiaceae bacterium]|nr:copper amine oxidase N-terminal domain-containing protein [Clostridiaceae bacterium]